jgi:formylglycine-generating enzyme required for sulfatase activity
MCRSNIALLVLTLLACFGLSWAVPLPPARDSKEVVVDLGGGVKMEFVRVPKGVFKMGSSEQEDGREDNEELHDVEITRDFYLGKYTVTQEQYEWLMKKNPSCFSAGGCGKAKIRGVDTKRLPVEQVSWDNAVRFCERLTEKHGMDGRKFRLPSEAEWEYACRSGSETRYYFGDDEEELDKYAWYRSNSGDRPHEVGTRKPNVWRFYDMHGNVCQWCADWYAPYPRELPKKDPLRTNSETDKDYRVLRGGSWFRGASICRAADRYGEARRICDDDVGFRVLFRTE